MWPVLILGGLFWAYKNGWGAWFGICPPGYTPGQDMFPTCRNSMEVAGDTLPVQVFKANPPPVQALPFPMVWGWNGSKWVQVSGSPRWP